MTGAAIVLVWPAVARVLSYSNQRTTSTPLEIGRDLNHRGYGL